LDDTPEIYFAGGANVALGTVVVVPVALDRPMAWDFFFANEPEAAARMLPVGDLNLLGGACRRNEH